MQEEKLKKTKTIRTKDQNEKLSELLEIAQKKYEMFLKTSLKSARKSYLRGKLEILKRISEGIEKLGEVSPSLYKGYLLSKKFEDVPSRKKIVEESEGLVGTNNVDTTVVENFENLEKECLGKRFRMEDTQEDKEINLAGIPIKKIH